MFCFLNIERVCLNNTELNVLIAGLIDAIMAVLVHPCQAARLAASWCLRCICVAVPSQITPLIDRCVDGIENMRSSPEAIAGYSSALAAVLGSVRLSPLGVPHTKGKVYAFVHCPSLLYQLCGINLTSFRFSDNFQYSGRTPEKRESEQSFVFKSHARRMALDRSDNDSRYKCFIFNNE